MLKIENNPIDILFKVFEDNYPEQAKKIKSVAFVKLKDGFAATVGIGCEYMIRLSPTIKGNRKITFEVATELLAHELAHIVNFDAEDPHGSEWEATFDRLNVLFCEFRDKQFKIPDSGLS